MTKRLYRDYIKRFLDIVLSAGAIIVLSPVMAVTFPLACQAFTMRILCSGETRA